MKISNARHKRAGFTDLGTLATNGTRIPISVILEQIAEGESWDTLLAGYPELKKEDIQAALLYAKASLDHTEVRAAYA